MIEVLLKSVGVHRVHGKHVLILEERGGRRLALWVGQTDADAAVRILESQPVTRPQPHDLLVQAIGRLGGECVQAAITSLEGTTYYAKLVIQQGVERIELDARPSDAVNVALRAKVPIVADDSLLAEPPSKSVEATDGGSDDSTTA